MLHELDELAATLPRSRHNDILASLNGAASALLTVTQEEVITRSGRDSGDVDSAQ
jgi:hypothetical protein